MKKFMLLLALLPMVSGQAYAYRSLRVSVKQKDGWGWWNVGEARNADELTIKWGPYDGDVDSVFITLAPFGKPIFRDKGFYVVKADTSAGDTTITTHLPEGVWLYARLFDKSGVDWEAGPAKAFWVKPLGWNGFPIFGSYLCSEFTANRVDTLNNYPILIPEIQHMGNDTLRRKASNSIRTTCGTKTLRIAHDYVQLMNKWNIFDNTVLDSCENWYEAGLSPYYFSGDTTTLEENIAAEDTSLNVDVGDNTIFDTWDNDIPYVKNGDTTWCYAAIQKDQDSIAYFEIVAIKRIKANNQVDMVRHEQRSPKKAWVVDDLIIPFKYQNPNLGYGNAIPPDLTSSRHTLRYGKYFEEWFNDILWDSIYNTRVDSNYWLDAYQNDTFFERHQSEHFSVDAMDEMVADFVNGDFGFDFGFMSNTRVNENTHFARMDSFATMGMYEETNLKNRMDSTTHMDEFEEAFSYSQYRHTKAVHYGTNQVPHFMAIDNDQDTDNDDDDIDDRRRLMAYATLRGMTYLKKKDSVYGTWNGERCVDEENEAKWPTDTSTDSDYYGWLGVPIEDCQLIVSSTTDSNLISDAGFNINHDAWEMTGGTITLTGIEPQEGDSCAKIHSDSTSGFNGSILSQDNDEVDLSTTEYSTLSFWVRADKPRLIDLRVKCGQDDLLARGIRFCPSAYWQRWLFRFKGDGDEGVRVEFHVGNGYEPDSDTVDVYLDNVELYEDDIWVGYSRKFEKGMVFYQHTDSDQKMRAWNTLKKISDPDTSIYAWRDTAHNSGGGFVGDSLTVPTEDDDLGGAYFLRGSPVLSHAVLCTLDEGGKAVYISDRIGDEYENDRTLDAYVSAKSGETTTNYGDETDLMLVNSPVSHRRFAYFKFNIGNLVPDTATVNCAKLYFVVTDAVGDNLNDTLVLYNVVDNWVEDEITWSIPASGSTWTGYHGLGSLQDSVFIDGTLFQEYGIDVENLVEDVLDGNGVPDGWLNVAVGDRAGGSVSHWLGSSEATDWYRPMLMITYLEE